MTTCVMKKTDAHRENSFFGISILLCVIGDKSSVFQPQAVDRIIKEEGAVGMEKQDLPHCDSLTEKFISFGFQCLQGVASQRNMKGARGNSKPAVDPSVEVIGDAVYSVPLHEGKAGTLSGIEEDMIDAPALRNRERLVNHDPEVELALIERTRGPHVMGCEADVVDRHGLWLGYPRGSDLDWLCLRIACRDQGYWLHRDS